jgi:hypothetical protein
MASTRTSSLSALVFLVDTGGGLFSDLFKGGELEYTHDELDSDNEE